jgi:hypothetical protein
LGMRLPASKERIVVLKGESSWSFI